MILISFALSLSDFARCYHARNMGVMRFIFFNNEAMCWQYNKASVMSNYVLLFFFVLSFSCVLRLCRYKIVLKCFVSFRYSECFCGCRGRHFTQRGSMSQVQIKQKKIYVFGFVLFILRCEIAHFPILNSAFGIKSSL